MAMFQIGDNLAAALAMHKTYGRTEARIVSARDEHNAAQNLIAAESCDVITRYRRCTYVTAKRLLARFNRMNAPATCAGCWINATLHVPIQAAVSNDTSNYLW